MSLKSYNSKLNVHQWYTYFSTTASHWSILVPFMKSTQHLYTTKSAIDWPYPSYFGSLRYCTGSRCYVITLEKRCIIFASLLWMYATILSFSIVLLPSYPEDLSQSSTEGLWLLTFNVHHIVPYSSLFPECKMGTQDVHQNENGL